MAQWNLSVDIRGQGTDLAGKLRASATQARALATGARAAKTEVRGLSTSSQAAARNLARTATQARQTSRELRQLANDAAQAERRLRAIRSSVRVQVRLDDQTATGAAAIQARLAALGGGNVNLTANLRTGNTAAAAAAFQAADNAARDLARTLRTLRGRAAAAAASLDELRAQAIAAATGVRSLNTAAVTADTRLNSMSDSTRTLTTRMGELNGSLARVGNTMGGVSGSLGTAGNSAGQADGRMRLLVEGAVALASALIPIAAATVPLAAGLTAAGAGAAVFGVAIAGQIKYLADAAEAETKYQEAVDEHGRYSKEAAEAQTAYVRAVEKMPAPTREAAAAFAVLKDNYKEFSDDLAGDTMPVATKSFAIFSRLLEDSTPLARTFGDGLERTVDIVAGGLQTESWRTFMADVDRFTYETLAKANHGLVQLTTGMNTGEVGGDLREFMAYAKANGPLVGDTLEEITSAAIHLLVAASDVGVGVLQLVNVLAKLVNAVPTSVLSTFLQLYAAMRLVTLGATALAAVTGGAAIARLGAYFAVMRAAGVATTLRATAASMSMVTKASIGLGVLAATAYGIKKLADNARGAPPDVDRLTTSLKTLAQTGRITGELKKTFTDISGLVDKIEILDEKTKELEKSRDGGGTGLGRIPVLDDVGDWLSDRILDMKDGEESITALTEDFKGLDETLAGLVASGHADVAAQNFDLISYAAQSQGISLKEVNSLLPQYNDALAAAAAEQQLASAAMGLFGDQALATKGKLDAQKASADGLRQAIQALNDTNRGALGGMIGFEQAIDDAAKAATENAGALTMTGGKLNLNSEKARTAATALQDLATKTDEAAAAARESGAPWSEVNAIYDRGRDQFIQTAVAMGLTEAQARGLAASIQAIPESKETRIEMRREDAIAGLDAVIAKIKATPGAKSVTVKVLTKEAMGLLNSLGYRTKTLPDGSVQVTARTGQALAGLGAVRAARNALSDKTITITTHYRITGNQGRRTGAHGSQLANADGSVTDYYADGGIRTPRPVRFYANGGTENHVAQIAPAGSWRVWGEPETGGEAYVPLAPGKRPRSRAIVEETVRRLGGDPATIQWRADGDVTDWRYDPTTGSLYSASDSGAVGHKTRKVKTKVKGKTTTKEINYFDLKAVEKSLKSVSTATRRWNADLEKVADRVGGDVAESLAAMGKDGVALTRKMATGSTKYINEMAAALRGLAAEAKASLTDYTRQLDKATTADATFAKNLATLAARGHGDLARQLAAQGDTAASQLAAAAVKDNKKATSANKAASAANRALTGDEVQQLVAIIAAIRTSKTGIHDVADATGLGEDDIIAIATKATGQIKSSLGTRSTRFLADLGRASRGLSYANGGIREGIYASQGGLVRFAEPQTFGEAYIPLGTNRRRQATAVLHDVARRFGVGLTDISAGRQVVVVKQGDTHITVPAVRTGASATDIGYQVGRSVRRARRGGVAARA